MSDVTQALMDAYRTIRLLNEYGQAKFGDEWWPGNAGEWIGKDKGDELNRLTDGAPGAT